MTNSEKAFPIYEPPTGRTPAQEAAVNLKYAYRRLYDEIEERLPSSRERSIALTELETSGMYAVKALHQAFTGMVE